MQLKLYTRILAYLLAGGIQAKRFKYEYIRKAIDELCEEGKIKVSKSGGDSVYAISGVITGTTKGGRKN